MSSSPLLDFARLTYSKHFSILSPCYIFPFPNFESRNQCDVCLRKEETKEHQDSFIDHKNTKFDLSVKSEIFPCSRLTDKNSEVKRVFLRWGC